MGPERGTKPGVQNIAILQKPKGLDPRFGFGILILNADLKICWNGRTLRRSVVGASRSVVGANRVVELVFLLCRICVECLREAIKIFYVLHTA